MIRTRRAFLSQAGFACLSLHSAWPADPMYDRHAMSAVDHGTVPPLLRAASLEPFVDALPIPPVATPLAGGPHGPSAVSAVYQMEMGEVSAKIHRDAPPTTFWSFEGTFPGPTIEARSGWPIRVRWSNRLPAKHFLPIDHKLCGAEPDKPEVRAVVHLHGGRVPADSDGYPERWFPPGEDGVVLYPNRQNAATLWYHDHTMGIERLNMYAGLFGAYLLRDTEEAASNLPSGRYEIPLMLCDRLIRRDGQLYYPSAPGAEGPWVPEVFGDCFLVNGKLLPYLEVEPRRYRFRIFNAANGRFFRLSMENGLELHQIGTDQGFLPAPVPLSRLLLAGGERADVVVDFSQSAGERIVLRNDILPLLQFRVSREHVTDTSTLPATLRAVEPIEEKEAITVRTLTLREYDNMAGKPTGMLLNGKRWQDPVTETPRQGSVEIWRFVNLTTDTHPIHLHQVRFQILDRQPFLVPAYVSSGTLSFRGPASPPAANESGWKDTVRVEGRSVTRIIVRFDGYGGRFVWHCHTLEHAANEMMRPYDIVG